jgi:GTP cyclohydrolase I
MIGMIDEAKVEQAVRLFLDAIGEDLNREGLKDTPRRISEMCHELFGGMGQNASEHLSVTFEASSNEMVLEKDITFYSVCEHHLLPFMGKAHIAYIPDGRVVGLSKLARTVETYARKPEYLKPKGVMVMLEAEHLCMSMRGVSKPGTKTVSFTCRGKFEGDEKLQAIFFSMVRG